MQTTNEEKSKKHRLPKKHRQWELSNNHACLTALLVAILSKHYKFICPYPSRVSSRTLDFIKISTMEDENGKCIHIYTEIKQRINQKRTTLASSSSHGNLRLNYERRFELYHRLIWMILSLEESFVLDDVVEEHAGISGDFSLRLDGIEMGTERILDVGKRIIQYIYEKREDGKHCKIIERDELTHFLFE